MSSFMHSSDTFYTIAHALATLKGSRHASVPLALEIRPMSTKQAGVMRGYDVRNATKVALEIVRTWQRANCRAIIGRYGERSGEMIESMAQDAPSNITHITRTQLYKIVQSVKYQCSEDVKPSEKRAHQKALNEMQALMHKLAESIVEASQEYEDAGWSTAGYDEQKARVKRELAKRRAEAQA